MIIGICESFQAIFKRMTYGNSIFIVSRTCIEDEVNYPRMKLALRKVSILGIYTSETRQRENHFSKQMLTQAILEKYAPRNLLNARLISYTLL